MQTTFREKEPRIGDHLSLYSCSFRGNIDLDSYMKKKPDTGVFLEFFQKFLEQLFCRLLPGDSLCTTLQYFNKKMFFSFHLSKTKINIPNLVTEIQFLDYSVLHSAITSSMDFRDISITF